jgi:hypothetical protein
MSELQLERLMEEAHRTRMEDSWIAWISTDSEDDPTLVLPPVVSTITKFAGSAARSIDPRDMNQPIIYRVDENYKKGE